MKNKKYLIAFIIVDFFIFLWIVLYIFFSWSKSQSSETTTVNINTQSIKQQQWSLKLPSEYNICKSQLDMVACILTLDKKQKQTDIINLLDKDFTVKRLDEIDTFKWALNIPQDKIVESISMIYQDFYILKRPSIVYENFNCTTEFCKNIIESIKVSLVQRLGERWLIKSKSVCQKISEEKARLECEKLFN